MDINDSLLSIHTITEKKVNEDYISKIKNEKLFFKGIVLGDGIGSHYKPENGSEFCVTKLVELLEECKIIDDVNFDKLFRNVSNLLIKKFTNNDTNVKPNQAYGTTLICVLEFKDRFEIAYIGNGSIWHLRGNFPKLISKQRYLPWNATNLLNPHTVDEGGREALYKFFSLDTNSNQIEPSTITLYKDNFLFGDLLIATTDGLYSNDHIPVAKDAEGGLWIAGEKKMELLFNSLKEFSKDKNLTNKILSDNLENYCESIKSQKLLDDDTTFGLLYSKKAIEYQNSVNEESTSK